MKIDINNTELQNIYFNGIDLQRVFFNDVLVFEKSNDTFLEWFRVSIQTQSFSIKEEEV